MPFMMGNMGPGGPNMRFPANMAGPRMGGPRSQGFQQIPPSGPMMRHQQGQMGGGPGAGNTGTGGVGGPNDQMARMRFPGSGGPMGPGGPGMIGGPGNVTGAVGPNTSIGGPGNPNGAKVPMSHPSPQQGGMWTAGNNSGPGSTGPGGPGNVQLGPNSSMGAGNGSPSNPSLAGPNGPANSPMHPNPNSPHPQIGGPTSAGSPCTPGIYLSLQLSMFPVNDKCNSVFL